MKKDLLGSITGFDWDEGNTKHIARHYITPQEAEEVFFDKNNMIDEDIKHSTQEDRFLVIGKTQKRKLLYQVFTIRGEKIRIISSRTINRKEVNLYEKSVSHPKIQKRVRRSRILGKS